MKRNFFTQKIARSIAAIIFIAVLSQGIPCHAQIPTRIWSFGGTDLYSVDSAGNNLQVRHDFSVITAPGANPYGNVILYNGKLYGVTFNGGINNVGVIFSYDTATGIATDLYDFSSATGSLPRGTLMVYNNQLYGMASSGGANSDGVIFSFNPATNAYADVYDFDGTHGKIPYYGALIAYNNILYGMTEIGGVNNAGVIFSFDPSTNTYADLFDLVTATGKNPYGSLLVYNSKLYGMANGGGANSAGVIFSLDPSNNTYTDVYDLSTATGSRPYGSLIISNNELYGMTRLGGANSEGVIFSFDPSNNTYTDVYDFDGTSGGMAYGDLLAAGSELYGMTENGGSYNSYGALFSFNIMNNTYTHLIDFIPNSYGADGGTNPYGNLLLCNNILYGMTNTGGGADKGTLFSFDTVTNNYSLLEAFGTTAGSSPGGYVALYNNNLYGTTSSGGILGQGNIYTINLLDSSYSILYNFNIDSGGYSASNLIAYGSKLWGTTAQGGDSSGGSIFSYNPSTNVFKAEYSFGAVEDGGFQVQLCPYNGKLYGVTISGGANNFGLIFSFDTATHTYTDLYDFSSQIGYIPLGGLTVYNNKLYGIGGNGGANSFGMIYSFDPATNMLTDVYDFDGTHGGSSYASCLYADAVGHKLYGTAADGANNDGVIFSFAPATGSYTDLYDFSLLTNGNWGLSTLTKYDGKLWGSTTTGDTTGNGLLFSIDTDGANFTVLENYTTGGGFANGSGSYLTVVPFICTLPVPVVAANGASLTTGTYDSYQWYLNGQVISNATSQNYTATANGAYYVVVSDLGGCSKQSATVTVSGLGVASIVAGRAAIRIYPNPNNGMFTIEGSLDQSKNVDIEVLNVIGQQVYQAKVPVTNGVINREVQLPEKDANGIYLLRITTDNGSNVIRFVVER